LEGAKRCFENAPYSLFEEVGWLSLESDETTAHLQFLLEGACGSSKSDESHNCKSTKRLRTVRIVDDFELTVPIRLKIWTEGV
jgi:hypothetical protein